MSRISYKFGMQLKNLSRSSKNPGNQVDSKKTNIFKESRKSSGFFKNKRIFPKNRKTIQEFSYPSGIFQYEGRRSPTFEGVFSKKKIKYITCQSSKRLNTFRLTFLIDGIHRNTLSN
ncbi:hypothetical protein ACFFRR_003909 [Megaselia abdita]